MEVEKKRWREYKSVPPPYNLATVHDLLEIAWRCDSNENFEWFNLWKLIPALTELDNIIGMDNLKNDILDIILYYLMGFHKTAKGKLLNFVILGKPGAGKTKVANILAKIFANLGYLNSDNVVSVKRTDLISKWVGHSEAQTLEKLESALGGVLFIDEVSSLGAGEKTDSFTKAAVDTINQFITDNQGKFLCIISGYEKEIEEDFFSVNPGLRRRFPWRIKIDSYTAKELHDIFMLKVKEDRWTINKGAISQQLFKVEDFEYLGGDVEIFLSKCQICHSRRIFGGDKAKMTLTKEDIEQGFSRFKEYKTKTKPPMETSVKMIYS